MPSAGSEASRNEIAKAAGLTMAGLIHHFPIKVDLFAAVLAARDADDHARLHGLLGDEPTGLQVLDGVGTSAIGEVLDARNAFLAALGHVAGAELLVQLLALFVSAHGDHSICAELRRRKTPTGRLRRHLNRHTESTPRQIRGVPSGRHHIRQRQQWPMGRAFQPASMPR